MGRGGAVTLSGGEEKLKRACRFGHAPVDESSRAGDVNLSSVLMSFCKFTAYSHASGAAGQNTQLQHKLMAGGIADGVKMLLTPILPMEDFFFFISLTCERVRQSKESQRSCRSRSRCGCIEKEKCQFVAAEASWIRKNYRRKASLSFSSVTSHHLRTHIACVCARLRECMWGKRHPTPELSALKSRR